MRIAARCSVKGLEPRPRSSLLLLLLPPAPGLEVAAAAAAANKPAALANPPFFRFGDAKDVSVVVSPSPSPGGRPILFIKLPTERLEVTLSTEPPEVINDRLLSPMPPLPMKSPRPSRLTLLLILSSPLTLLLEASASLLPIPPVIMGASTAAGPGDGAAGAGPGSVVMLFGDDDASTGGASSDFAELPLTARSVRNLPTNDDGGDDAVESAPLMRFLPLVLRFKRAAAAAAAFSSSALRWLRILGNIQQREVWPWAI